MDDGTEFQREIVDGKKEWWNALDDDYRNWICHHS